MPTCLVSCCFNRTTNKSKEQQEREEDYGRISFHRFPKDNKLRKLWLNAISGKEKWTPTSTSVICSDHFTSTCFDKSPFYTKLLDGTVPSIFPITKNESTTQSTSTVYTDSFGQLIELIRDDKESYDIHHRLKASRPLILRNRRKESELNSAPQFEFVAVPDTLHSTSQDSEVHHIGGQMECES